jgi:hypothetical protein
MARPAKGCPVPPRHRGGCRVEGIPLTSGGVLLLTLPKMAWIPLANFFGVFTLVDDADAQMLGQWRWRLDSRGYPYTTRDGARVHMHRLLMQPEPGQHVDHRNGIRLDNRRGNLRFATRLENTVNRTKHKKTKSSYVGVRPSPNGKSWIARVGKGGIHVGVYATERAAARARDRAAVKLYGERVTLNVTRNRERSALRKSDVVLPERLRATRTGTQARRAHGALRHRVPVSRPKRQGS